ncbi:hypothetical protein [Mangrovibacillus cuniculi]|uniref:Uncharacterized protein n=1 Tax=Mangrovibacillus cuniculi TaxID=2593652 RepID=A0A7S8C9F8_9BACI|nr:hypothetical protein [Mangrovibacillus cuniculi]QPC45855.1 hypothetical protein G8O30_02225 [Mangrovibacillus cuniculi]
MDIQIGYLPKRTYSIQPSIGGNFPFALTSDPSYVLKVDRTYLPEINSDFFPLWMKNIKAYPLYICAEFPLDMLDEFENECKELVISNRCLKSKDYSLVVTEIKNELQFRELFPYYITIGFGIGLVLWSTNKDIISVVKREWKGGSNKGYRKGKHKPLIEDTLVVDLDEETSIFWIGYDGDNFVVISNRSSFSTYEQIVQTLPDFVVPNIVEFE